MMLIFLIISLGLFVAPVIDGSHFLGGTITWRLLNASATGTPVAVIITQTTSWNYTSVKCTTAGIINGSVVSNVASLSTVTLKCINNCGPRSVGYPSNVSVTPICTGFSAPIGTTVGQRSDVVYLSSGDDFSVAFALGAWRTLATITGGNWSLSAHINVTPRPDTGLYNNAPVATVMSPINLPYNETIAIHIPVGDADGDVLRCRWANNSNEVDECSSVCPPASLPPNTIIYPNCTIIITGRNLSDWYAVAVVVEDFINSSSTTPMSSVPIQFLAQVVSPSTCLTPPDIIGIPAEQSCTPVVVNHTFVSRLIAINHCGVNVTIVDIATLSFNGVIINNITKQNSTTYYKSFSWMPTTAELGYQVMCAMAIDSQNSQSAQYCFKFYVSQSVASDCPGQPINTTTITITTTTTRSTNVTANTTTSTNITTDTTTSIDVTIDTTTLIDVTMDTTSSIDATTDTITSIDAMTDTTSEMTSMMIIDTDITSISITTVLASATSISNTSMSYISDTTTTTKRKPNPVNWPLIGVVAGLLLLGILALCCCFCWHYICPLAAGDYRNKNDATPVLYHIERCVDPDCDWSNRSGQSDISSLSFRNHRIHTTFSDKSATSYIKLLNLSSATSTNTENKSNASRFASFSSVKIDRQTPTIRNSENIRVSRISWAEKPKSASFHNKLSRNSIRPCVSQPNNSSNNSVRVTRVRSVLSNVTCPSTINDTRLSKFEDTIYLDESNEAKRISSTVDMTDSPLKHVYPELMSTEANHLSQIDQTGISPSTLKSKSVTPVRSHIRVKRIPRTMKKTDSRHSASFPSGIRVIQKTNGILVKRISRKSIA